MEISKEEYFRLKCDSIKLQMLEAGGVDNWEGYSISLYDLSKDYDEEVEALKKELGL
jgi:hypothetical protein